MATVTIEQKLTNMLDARNVIRTKLVELGLADSSAKLEALANAIDDIVNCGAISATIQEGTTYTIPAGYHNGSGTVSGISGGGNYNLQSKSSIIPTKKQQHITADEGYFGLSDVTIEAIPSNYQDVSSVDAKAADVLTGKIIVLADGSIVPGTMPDNGEVSKLLDATTVTYTIPKGYHTGAGKVTITLEEKDVTPSKTKQEVTPTQGKVLSKVTVKPIPDEFQDISGTTATAPRVLDGDKFINASGVEETGSMPNIGAATDSLDGITKTSVTISAGYHNGNGVVTFDDTKIAEMLDAI